MRFPFPEKEYHDLQDAANRWKMTLSDLQYYAIHGDIKIMAWLDHCIMNVYHMKKTEDGQLVPVFAHLKPYMDFAILPPEELRHVFRGPSKIRKFVSLTGHELLKVNKIQGGYELGVNDLVISHEEFDRFAKQCVNNCQSVAGKPHRPMDCVRQHFRERGEANTILPSLNKEAAYLTEWAKDHIKEGEPPTFESVRNAIRVEYKHYRKNAKAASDTA